MSSLNAVYIDPDNGNDLWSGDAPFGSAYSSSPIVTITNGITTGNLLTSASSSFVSATTGVVMTIWTPAGVLRGYRTITALTSTSIAVLGDTAIGTATGNVCYIGGALKTINGASANLLATAATCFIAKSPPPISVGSANWVGFPTPTTMTITGASTQSPIVITCTTHGLINNDWCMVNSIVGNTNANGMWPVAGASTNVFQIVGSSANAAWTSGGTVQKCNNKVVTLNTAQTQTLSNCEPTTAWTGANGGVVAMTIANTDAKEGGGCLKVTAPASGGSTNALHAYSLISGSTDLSTYGKVSFWFKNEAAVLSNYWKLCFCSDTAGATTVNNFSIPAIPSVSQWLPLTLTTDNAAAMGSTIQSIALYSGATAPTASKYIYLDNILACSTTGLNLQSLISKNQLQQSSTASVNASEGWYGIQSINETAVVLDNHTNAMSHDGQGYSDATTSNETVATYIRETTKTSLATLSTTVVQSTTKSGTLGNLISFEGGYNTATNTRDGETFFDGLNGFGYGVVLFYNYNTLNYINAFRYNQGLRLTGTISIRIINVSNANNCSSIGLMLVGYDCILDNAINCNNNATNACYLGGTAGNRATVSNMINVNNNIGVANNGAIHFTVAKNFFIGSVTNLNNNGFYGVSFYQTSYSVINNITHCNYNGNTGIYNYIGFNNLIRNLSTAGNVNSGITVVSDSLIVKNWNAVGTEYSALTSYGDIRLYSWNHDLSGNHYVFTDNAATTGAIVSTSAVGKRHTASGLAWQFNPTALRISTYPLTEKLAQVYVAADNAVTIKCWVLKDHATNIAARLVVRGGQLAGMTTADYVSPNKADDTDYEQLTVTSFTPTEAGTITVEASAWYVAGNSAVYFDDLTVEQGGITHSYDNTGWGETGVTLMGATPSSSTSPSFRVTKLVVP